MRRIYSEDLTGQKFNRWVVLEKVGKNKYGAYLYRCRCDCGNERVVIGSNLRTGTSKSCGCYMREVVSKTNRDKKCSEEVRKKISKSVSGHKHTKESKMKMLGLHKGKNSGNYIHGLTGTKEYCNKMNAKKRATKRNQTPQLTHQEQDKITMMYRISEYLGVDWEVDHIHPLSKGGLHHPDNLQVVTKEYNRSKYNNENFREPKILEVFRI